MATLVSRPAGGARLGHGDRARVGAACRRAWGGSLSVNSPMGTDGGPGHGADHGQAGASSALVVVSGGSAGRPLPLGIVATVLARARAKRGRARPSGAIRAGVGRSRSGGPFL